MCYNKNVVHYSPLTLNKMEEVKNDEVVETPSEPVEETAEVAEESAE